MTYNSKYHNHILVSLVPSLHIPYQLFSLGRSWWMEEEIIGNRWKELDYGSDQVII